MMQPDGFVEVIEEGTNIFLLRMCSMPLTRIQILYFLYFHDGLPSRLEQMTDPVALVQTPVNSPGIAFNVSVSNASLRKLLTSTSF